MEILNLYREMDTPLDLGRAREELFHHHPEFVLPVAQDIAIPDDYVV